MAYCDASRHFLAARRPLAIIGLQLKSAPGAKEIKLCYAILLHTLSREQVFFYLQSWLKLNLHKKKLGNSKESKPFVPNCHHQFEFSSSIQFFPTVPRTVSLDCSSHFINCFSHTLWNGLIFLTNKPLNQPLSGSVASAGPSSNSCESFSVARREAIWNFAIKL